MVAGDHSPATDLQHQLIAAAQRGQPLTTDELGDLAAVADGLPIIAATPLAPLAAEVIARAASEAGYSQSPWTDIGQSFARHLGQQNQVLALLECLDVLLGSEPSTKWVAAEIHGALLGGIDDALDSRPELAAARLEGSLRVALAGYARPYLVLDRLTEDVSAFPESYRARLPVLLGAALDRWAGDTALHAPLLSALHQLANDDAADADAAFEIAMNHLRSSLSIEDVDAAVIALNETVELFDSAVALDEIRDDALIYRWVCRAVTCFANHDADGFTEASAAVEARFSVRERWQLNTHLPAWRHPAADTEAAWVRLVADLNSAHGQLDEMSWLSARVAVGQLLRIYRAERSIAPAGAVEALLSPVIVNRLATHAVLRDQLERAVVADRASGAPVLPASADLLLAAVRDWPRRRDRSPRLDRPADPGGTDAEDDAHDRANEEFSFLAHKQRVERVAPGLMVLGDQVCAALTHLDDEDLREAGNVVELLTESGRRAHPELARMWERIARELHESPRFTGAAAGAVTVMVKRTLTFLLDRYNRGGPIQSGGKDIIRPIRAGERRPVERDLQHEFYIWLAGIWELAGYVQCEKSDVSTGRVDVTVRIGEIEIVTEFKRELIDPTPGSLETKYLGQAAQYSGGSAPFSQLLVLDLSDHSAGVPPLDDLVWISRYRVDSASTTQYVIAGIVAGNRPSPSAVRASRKISPASSAAAATDP